MSRFNNNNNNNNIFNNEALGLAPSLSLLLIEGNNNKSNFDINYKRDCDKSMRSEARPLPNPRLKARNGYKVSDSYPVIEPIVKIKPQLPPKPSPRSKK
jgi:hypothetical protein